MSIKKPLKPSKALAVLFFFLVRLRGIEPPHTVPEKQYACYVTNFKAINYWSLAVGYSIMNIEKVLPIDGCPQKMLVENNRSFSQDGAVIFLPSRCVWEKSNLRTRFRRNSMIVLYDIKSYKLLVFSCWIQYNKHRKSATDRRLPFKSCS